MIVDKKLHPERWQAQWIWGPGEPAPENRYLHFRKTFESDSGVLKSTAAESLKKRIRRSVFR